MVRLAALAWLVLLLGCGRNAANQDLELAQASASAVSARNAKVVETATLQWRDCIVRSFQIQRTLMPDRAAAAETAFSACQTEESIIYRALAAQYPLLDASDFAQKQVLIRGLGKKLLMQTP